MKKKQYNIILISSLVILALLAIFLGNQTHILPPEPISQKLEIQKQSLPPKDQIKITVIAGDKTLNLISDKGASLYSALVSAKENGQIEFSGKDYSGLGFLMTDIGSLHSGGGKYLFYYINNKEASVGVSAYKPSDGDIILWKLQ